MQLSQHSKHMSPVELFPLCQLFSSVKIANSPTLTKLIKNFSSINSLQILTIWSSVNFEIYVALFLMCLIRSKKLFFTAHLFLDIKCAVLNNSTNAFLLQLTLSISEFCVPDVIYVFMLPLGSILWRVCFLLIAFLCLSPLRCCWNILLGSSSKARALLFQKSSPVSECSSHILHNHPLLVLLKYDQAYSCYHLGYIPNVFMDVSFRFLVF